MKAKLGITFLLLMLIWVSCSWFGSNKPKGSYVARVYDKYLMKEELEGLVPEGTSSKDSNDLTKTFIDTWIRQMLLLHQAENNIDYNEDDFNREIEKYRNSLIIFRYESELVNQKMDTVVLPREILEFYDKNKESFVLHENIIRADYVLQEKSRKDLNLIKTLLQSSKPSDIDKLEEYCRNNGIEHKLNDSTWITFSELNAKIPLNSADYDKFMSGTRWFENNDSVYNYLIRINDFKVKEGSAPLSFEYNKIKAAILNKRKAELLHKLENDLYTQASKGGKFEIY